MTWYQLLTVVGVPTLISGIFMLMINRNLTRRDEERKKAESEALQRDKDIKALNAEMETQNKAMMSAIQAMLRDRLLQGYRHYFAKGWADYDDRENLENIYGQYHALGKNGIMDEFRERFMALPVTKDNEEVR